MFWFACVVIDVNDDGDDEVKFGYSLPKFMVIGHRGSGMNILQSCDPRMKSIQENSILSFNAASKFPIDFIEFDVQVFPFFLFFYKCSCLVSKKRKMCSRFKNSKIKLCSVNSGKNILNTFIIRSIRVKFQDFSSFFVSYAVQDRFYLSHFAANKLRFSMATFMDSSTCRVLFL